MEKDMLTNKKDIFNSFVTPKLKGKTILVTGGTGFIGGRLVERLVLEYDAHVRVLVRNFSKSARIARFPIEFIKGDITDEKTLNQAIKGCDLVFHCAFDPSGTPKQNMSNIRSSTEIICNAVTKYSVSRLVHISTISVYNERIKGVLDETAPRKPSFPYGKTKLIADKIISNYCNSSDLPATIIQPTIVYGPYSNPWTIGPTTQLLKCKVVLLEGGEGFCNAVYVDDVINGMILAAIQDKAIGQSFLISSEKPVKWKDFYCTYEKMLGVHSTISLSIGEMKSLIRKNNNSLTEIKRILHEPGFWKGLDGIHFINSIKVAVEKVTSKNYKEIAKSKLISNSDVLKTEPVKNSPKIIFPNLERQTLLLSKYRVSIQKAKDLLGYQPFFEFADGMKLTSDFVKWYYSL